jgi:hypothetical protein
MRSASRCSCRLPDVGVALDACDGADHPRRMPICAVCALAYREDPIAQLHALAEANPGLHQTATIYLLLLEPASLADADPSRIREMFRKRLDRAGFKGKLVVGGIEVAWQEVAALARACSGARHRRRRGHLGAARSGPGGQRNREARRDETAVRPR